MKETRILFLNTKIDISFGRVKICVKSKHIFWIIFSLGSVLSYTDKLYPMGTNCAPLIADLFLFSYGQAFMASLFYNK